MTLRNLIERLEALEAEHGDLPVETYGSLGRQKVREPSLAHRKMLNGRQTRQEFWHPLDGESARGEKVIRL